MRNKTPYVWYFAPITGLMLPVIHTSTGPEIHLQCAAFRKTVHRIILVGVHFKTLATKVPKYEDNPNEIIDCNAYVDRCPLCGVARCVEGGVNSIALDTYRPWELTNIRMQPEINWHQEKKRGKK